jgi:hypothetical protein
MQVQHALLAKEYYTECGASQLTENADNECKNETKANIVTC